MVATLIFTPKKKSLLSLVQGLFGGGHTNRRAHQQNDLS
jgi:hypothetical protein